MNNAVQAGISLSPRQNEGHWGVTKPHAKSSPCELGRLLRLSERHANSIRPNRASRGKHGPKALGGKRHAALLRVPPWSSLFLRGKNLLVWPNSNAPVQTFATQPALCI